MIDPREWSCTDDSPLNNGWGYNYPDERDEPEDIDEPEIEEE